MEKRTVKDRNTNLENRLKRHRKKLIRNVIILSMIVIAVCMFLLNRQLNKIYHSYDVEKTIDRKDSASVKYLSYGSKLIRYSRDGISVLDSEGKEVWNSSYEMKDPIVEYCGDYVAVADRGNKVLYVINSKGQATEIEVTRSIVKIQVAAQGVVAVLSSEKDADYIEIYSTNGSKPELLVDNGTFVTRNGYPIDFSLSEDGRKMVTSYMLVTSNAIENFVTFYNFGSVGQNFESKIVGAFPYKDKIVPKVEFLTNNTVCIYEEAGFTLYKMSEKPEDIAHVDLENEIISTFSNGEYIGFVTKNQHGKEDFEVVVYNITGKKVLTKSISYKYNQIIMSGEEIIFYSDMDCAILKINGVEKFKYTFDKTISYFMPINNKDKYFVIDNANIEQVKLVGDKK